MNRHTICLYPKANYITWQFFKYLSDRWMEFRKDCIDLFELDDHTRDESYQKVSSA